ncbi:MAG: MobF family relaxase [Corynebacterium sp.]|nr:MobF family relaxase [Corynebacterium sp.]
MSLRAVNAGRGYEYLLRSVATNDARDSASPSLSAYYLAKGTPPGRWLGRGLSGLNSEVISSGEEITELQMAALYGEGIHPDTDALMARGVPLKDCFIGRGFPNFTANDPVLIALRDAELSFRNDHQRLPSEDERYALVQEVAAPLFEEHFGTAAASGQELVAWVNKRKDRVRQAVAGYDFTFSPVKSISAVWALADEETAAKIMQCHHRAVAQALEWAEEEFIRTRSGAGGKRQVKTRGIIAAEFTHFDTRAGDPDLHSHVLIANKVQDSTGKWKALDGRTIFRFHQAMSWRYDALVRDEITRTLGLDFTAHSRGENKQPVWEIAGVDDQVLALFSKRRAGARPVFDAKVSAYIERTGARPGRSVMRELWQQAILETRDAKKPAEALADLRKDWESELVDATGGREVVDKIRQLGQTHRQARPCFNAEQHSAVIAQETIEIVTKRRSTFRRSHVHTALSSVLAGYHFPSAAAFASAHSVLVDNVISSYGLSLNSTEQLSLPSSLVGDDGHGVDRKVDDEIFTTAELLAAEEKVLHAADEPSAEVVSTELFAQEICTHLEEKGWSLNAGQRALAQHLLMSGTLVATGVGPAGTGKTAAMAVVAQTWLKSGRNVIGLAPSAAAAEVLSGDICAPAHTIDSLTFTWRGKHPHKPGSDASALPIQIHRGDMLLVDEAGMASTDNMAALVEIARDTGAIVRFVGDHKQLSAVENGGLFGALATLKPSAQLTDVMRFGDDTDQAVASMKLRDGDASGLDFYSDRGWIHGGQRQLMLTQAAEDYLADCRAERRSLVLASTNDDVAFINDYVRNVRIAQGVVDPTESVLGAGGVTIGLGDSIIARRNRRFITERDGVDGKVVNGDIFTVVGITDRGDVEVLRSSGQRQYLPAAYVRDNVQLGYAATVHRAQGATVDVTRAVIDSHTDRAGLYVALSRGRVANHAYVVDDIDFDFEAEDGHYHYQGEAPSPTPRQVLDKVVSRDTREKSAMETLHEQAAMATGAERIAELWAIGKDLVIEQIIERELPDWLASLPEDLARNLRESGSGSDPIRSAWRTLLAVGQDPAELMESAFTNIDDADDVGRLVAYRLRQNLSDKFVEFSDTLPPDRCYIDDDMWQWMTAHCAGGVVEARCRPELEPGQIYLGKDFSGMDLSSMDLTSMEFRDCDFTGADFSSARLDDAEFKNCRMSDASFTSAALSRTYFTRCELDRADFSGAVFGSGSRVRHRTVFTRCQAALMVLRDATIHALEFITSTVPGMDLSHATISWMRLDRTVADEMVVTDTTIGQENIQTTTKNVFADSEGSAQSTSSQPSAHSWLVDRPDYGLDF